LAGLVVSCEHGGKRVPAPLAALFRGRARWLASHRGWDPGALTAARALARATGAPLVAHTITRLLVDANRSPSNPAVFSAATRRLAPDCRALLLDHYHRPHWQRVRRALRAAGARGRPVLHVAVHSFTPRFRGERRDFEIGLLYDPRRRRERSLAAGWKRRLYELDPELRVRRNAPYRGDADGLTTALRRELGASRYLGLELELAQAALARPAQRRHLLRVLTALLRSPLPVRPARRPPGP
jgi:predicted N-formylglutamate amidohydrolase